MLSMKDFHKLSPGGAYTLKELSQMFCVSKSTVVRWCNDNNTTPYSVLLMINNWGVCGPLVMDALDERNRHKHATINISGARLPVHTETIAKAKRKKRAAESLAQSRATARKRRERKAAKNDPSFL